MSEEEELRDYVVAEGVADALKEGDFEAFADLADCFGELREGADSRVRAGIDLGPVAR